MLLVLHFIVLALVLSVDITGASTSVEEKQYGVRYATNCEVCKLVTKEIAVKLLATESSGVVETGYNMDRAKKKTKYNLSELRLVEVLESVCEGMTEYKIHKERHDSTRWAKMMSQTFQTLHGLVNKGVKVDLGIPFELWDKPSAEVSHLKTQCDQFIEDNEDAINEWYFQQENPSSGDLQETVCPKLLGNEEAKCLAEPYGETIKNEEESEEQPLKSSKSGKKGDIGKNEL